MNELNLAYLRYAKAVARAGSFSRAARECAVTQPALSNGIAVLERGLGGRLFQRSTRGVSPTPFGERMLPLIEHAVAGFDAVLAEARIASRQPRPLRVGVSPLISADLIGRAFEAANTIRPEPGIVLRAANQSELRRALAEGELDLLLVPDARPDTGLQTGAERAVVAREPMMFLAPPGPGPGPGPATPVTLHDAAATPVILPTDACGLTPFTRQVFADHGIPLATYPGQAHDCRTIQDWVALGLGTALLPKSKVNDGMSARPVHVDGTPLVIAYIASWLATSPRAPEIDGIVTALRAAAPAA